MSFSVDNNDIFGKNTITTIMSSQQQQGVSSGEMMTMTNHYNSINNNNNSSSTEQQQQQQQQNKVILPVPKQECKTSKKGYGAITPESSCMCCKDCYASQLFLAICPNDKSIRKRMEVYEFIRDIASKHSMKAYLFGSVGLKTFLPNGDIDIALVSSSATTTTTTTSSDNNNNNNNNKLFQDSQQQQQQQQQQHSTTTTTTGMWSDSSYYSIEEIFKAESLKSNSRFDMKVLSFINAEVCRI